MRGLIRASLMNPWAVTVFALTIALLGGISVALIPIDILPVFKSPAVQVLTFYGGMPPRDVERDITNRIERWTDIASGIKRQESRSILGISVVRNYFYEDVQPGEALSSVLSLAQSVVPQMPPGTLPPIVMPFDPTSTTPVCMVALNSESADEIQLYDVGRYEVRNKVMEIRGAVSPVVFGGKLRAVQVYLDREKMMARDVAPLDVMRAVADSNVFLPTGEAIIGDRDYFLNSNALFDKVTHMDQIPLRTERGNRAFVGDVARATDDAMIQTAIVRVEGRKQVYVPVMRQVGASTLKVIDQLRARLSTIKSQLSDPSISLEVIMDQSVYVRQSISSLATEASLGAVLCSLTILAFLGRWQMTAIAVSTIPLSVLSALGLLYAFGQTINVMTLSGLALAVGPMVDSAIICLENTDRHLEMGDPIRRSALFGASEVALPELVSSLSTLLVLSPLALMPGTGSFLFRPMTMAVGFSMATAYILSRTVVPTYAAMFLKPKPEGEREKEKGPIGRGFDRWLKFVDAWIREYGKLLDWVLLHRWPVVIGAFLLLALTLGGLIEPLRKEFFPQVDSGAFEIYARCPSGTKIEKTNARIAEAEKFIREKIPKSDLKLIVSEIGVNPDISSAYTLNQAKMDAIIRIQLTEGRKKGSYQYADVLRKAFADDDRFADLEIAFNAGGLIQSALNQGRATPINVRVTGKQLKESHHIAELIRRQVANIDGVVDPRILQRIDYPEYIVEVDRAKAADLGLTQEDVMRNVIAAFNSSIQFNKQIFWIDRANGNQYFVGVQYPLEKIDSLESLLNVPITGINQTKSDSRVAVKDQRMPTLIPRPTPAREESGPPTLLRNLVHLSRSSIPTEVTHLNIRPSIDLNINVYGRDLGHVAADVNKVVEKFGKVKDESKSGGSGEGTTYDAYDPESGGRRILEGTEIIVSGEYARMTQTFRDLGIGLVLAVIIIYFMMVALDKSFLVPLCVLIAVPLILVGTLPMLYFTGTSLNVQSLLGIIFSVGIKVANTVLMTDVAQDFRKKEGLSPTEAIRKAAEMRVRPITMTALAAFFAMIPTALALETGSEANAPLGRAILGGLLAGEPATLFVVPALYSLMIHGDPKEPEDPEADGGNDEGDEE